MELWLDRSLSAEEGVYRETLRGLVASLPLVVAKHRIARIKAYRFGESGWNALEILRVDLASHLSVRTSEPGILYGQIEREQQKQNDQHHQDRLRERLAAVTVEKLLPGQTPEPRCTDLQGVISRIAETSHRGERLVFLLTDGHDTCSRRLQPVSLAKSKVALIVVLLPEESKAREPQRHDLVWIERRAQLEQALPGAIVIPHFGDPVVAADEALKK